MVEVFRTNVETELSALEIICSLKQLFPNLRINFDLQDCDRILRVQGTNICVTSIREVLEWKGFNCETLED
jgi:hypothetical protein